MASTHPKLKPTQRISARVSETTQHVLKERVAVTSTTASRGASNDRPASKSLFSKIKLVVAPPSKILRRKGDTKISSVISRDVPAWEHANKSACSKDNDATRPSKIPRFKRVTENKGVSIFTKFKRVMGFSKIPRLKREDHHDVHGVPSPVQSICRGVGGDPFAAYGDSFYSNKRASIVAVPDPALSTKPVADDIQVEAYRPPAALVFPPVKPLNIVKKRSVVPAQPNVSIPSPCMDDYPSPRKPVVSSDLDIVQMRKEITGLPPDYCVAGARYHTTHARDARKAIPAVVSSQLPLNVDIVQAKLLPASSDAVHSPDIRRSIFSKMKQSIHKSARSIFKPGTPSRTCMPEAPLRYQSPIRPSVGRTTAFVVDTAQNAPSPEENSIRKPTIFLSPAKKVYRPRGSIPPISGLMMPDKCKSAHGICQLRRQGKATGLVCICYKKFMKSRQKFANYAPAILSDIIEDRPVTFFPRRRSFNLDGGAKYLLSLYLDDEVNLSAQNISPLASGSGISLASSSSSPSVSNDHLICLFPSSVSSSSSVSTLDESLNRVLSPLESAFLSVSHNSFDNVSPRLEDSFDSVSLCVSKNDIEPVTSLVETLLESLSPLSISDENLESVPVSPSYSVLNDYFDNTSLSSSSLLSSTESPESTTPPIEGLTGDALGSLGSVTISSECHTASDISILDIPLNLRLAFDTKTLSKKTNRSARILPSASLGLGISFNINDNKHFSPATIRHEISVDAIDDRRLGSSVMKPEAFGRLECPILSVNTAASSPISSLDESYGSVTPRSQDNGDCLSSLGDTPTSPFSISSIDAEDSRSYRAAAYRRRLPIGVAPLLPSRRVVTYGSVSPRQHPSPVPRTSFLLSPAQPIHFVDALNRSAMQYESIQRPAIRLNSRAAMCPTPAAQHEHSTNAQYPAHQRTKRPGLTAPLPF